jgi:HD-GYP domain-containing protein (c-di-GMP phosphodiesterase class II)
VHYLAIAKDMLVEDTEVGCDLYLRSYVNGYPRYVLFCRGDEQFGSDRRGVLIEGNIEKLYILSKDYNNFFKYQERNLPNILANNNLSSREKSHAVYHVAKSLTKEILKDISTVGADLDRAKNWVKYTIGFILNDENAFSGLLSMTSHDYYTYTHSINLSVFGLLFGKHLSLGTDNLNTFGTGMLLHDVGKIEVPVEILNKPGKLTKDEFGIIKGHPGAGYKLLKNKENIEEKSLKAVIQHHENYDGTGYPHGIGGKEIDLYGRLSRIIDVYDAITTKRSYAGAMNPFTALKEMGESMINCFDMELFKEFVRFLGPKGSQLIKGGDGIVCLRT